MSVLSCFLHFIIIASGVIYTILDFAFYFIYSSKPKKVDERKYKGKFSRWIHSLSNSYRAYLINIAAHFLIWIGFIIIPHCWLCTVLIVLYGIWFGVTIAVIFFRQKIVAALIKKMRKGKMTPKKIKMVTKLNQLKNKIEMNDSAITLNDAFVMAPALKTRNFNLKKINEYAAKNKKIELKDDENFSGTKKIRECFSLYATVVGEDEKIKKDRFAMVYEIVKKKYGEDVRSVILFLNIGFSDRKNFFFKYPNACVSKFPIKGDFVCLPIDDDMTFESLENLFNQAYKNSIEVLEAIEFDKASEELKVTKNIF